ncbi:hypothetical protein GGR57DRAFT_487782 [Xylariaceae sp. FL1272]|nr:hypothetical protein GGR57DRAFT_487782 [Xylariaceae sp. FL1272]
MDSLRAQLAETQGALTERDKKFRQLRAEKQQAEAAWEAARQKLEARIQVLEDGNGRTLLAPPSSVGHHPAPPTDCRAQIAGVLAASSDGALEREDGAMTGPDNVTMSRHDVLQAQTKYARVKNELLAVTERYKDLQIQAAQWKPTTDLEATDDEVVAQWNMLREQIRILTVERLNRPIPAKLISDKCREEFKSLSPHWKTYTSTSDLVRFLFQALIWRYLLRLFEVPCRSRGREISNKLQQLAATLLPKLCETQYQEWRIRTSTLIHETHPVDTDLINELTTKICQAIVPLIPDTDDIMLRDALHYIVKTSSEISALLDRSRFRVLMHSEPGSIITHSFPFAESLMDLRGKLGTQGIVDLMITPSLLKKKTDYSVFVKAEVVSG